MKTTARLDVSPVGTYYAQLAVMLKQDLPRTVRTEAAATVRRAMRFVSASKSSEVKASALKSGVAAFREVGSFGGTTSVGKRSKVFGQQWMVGVRGRKPMPMGIWNGKLGALKDHTGLGNRATDADWQRLKGMWAKNAAETKKNIAARKAARGITAKSWYEMLVKLNAGSTDGVAAFITRARPISGRNRPVAFVGGTGEGSSQYNLTVVNTSGVAVATEGQRKLDLAITIRRKFFMDSMQRNFLFDAEFVARNYPWAKVT
jgi:hypothetical protein